MPRKKQQGVTVAALSDTHCGSTLGLMYPKEYQFADRDARPSALQRSLWERFEEYAATVADKRQGNQLIVVINGDTLDGDHHDTHQLVTRKMSEQRAIFADALDHFLKIVAFDENDRLYFVSGTEPTHGNAGDTDDLARDFGAIAYRPPPPDDERGGWYPWPELQLDIRGHLFRFAHHPPAGLGTRAHTKGNAVRSWLRSMQMQHFARGLQVPRFVVWGHVHTAHVERAHLDNGQPFQPVTEAVVLPCFQLPTEYVHRRIPFALPTTIGGWWATVSADGAHVDHGLDFVEFDARPEPVKI